MPRSESNRVIKVMSLSEYCLNRTMKNNMGFVIKPTGESYYVDGGVETPSHIIDELYPTPSKLFVRENIQGELK